MNWQDKNKPVYVKESWMNRKATLPDFYALAVHFYCSKYKFSSGPQYMYVPCGLLVCTALLHEKNSRNWGLFWN